MTKYFPFQFDHGSTDPSTWILPEGSIARIGRGGIQDTAFSPDGKLLTIATYLGLWWYDVQKQELITLWEKDYGAYSVTFSACGEWIATSWGAPIRIWEVTTGECIIELPREENIPSTEIVFSPNREYLAVGGYSRYANPEKKLYCCVELWKLPKNNKEIGTTDFPKLVGKYVGTNPLAISPDNRLLAFASPDGVPEPYNKNGFSQIGERGAVLYSDKMVVYEIESGRHITTLSGMERISSISFSPDGRCMSACDWNGYTQVWEVPNSFSNDQNEWMLQTTYQKRDEEGLQSISYTPENRLFSTFYHFKDDTFSVKDLENGETLYKHKNETGFYNTDFSSNVHLAFESENNFHYWKLGDKQPVSLEHSSGVWPSSLQFSSDGRTVYDTTGFWGILSYDITNPNKPPQIFKPHIHKHENGLSERYKSVVISKNGRTYVTSGNGNSVRLWELGKNTPIVSFPIESGVSDVIFSPIKNLLACKDDEGKIYIWDITANEIYDTFVTEDSDSQPYITFSPAGEYLICHSDGQIYDVDERKLLDRYSSDDSINFQAFSSEETEIWCDWNNDTIDLWDFLKDEEVMSIPKPEWWDSKHIESLSVSTCGKYLACSPDTWDSNDNLCVWDITKGKEPIAKFTTQDSPKCLSFSHDNTILAGCYGNGSILLWDLTPYI